MDPLGTMNDCLIINVMATNPIVVEIFHSNPKFSTSLCSRKSKRITNVSRIHPLGTQNVCIKFNPFHLIHQIIVEIFSKDQNG